MTRCLSRLLVLKVRHGVNFIPVARVKVGLFRSSHIAPQCGRCSWLPCGLVSWAQLKVKVCLWRQAKRRTFESSSLRLSSRAGSQRTPDVLAIKPAHRELTAMPSTGNVCLALPANRTQIPLMGDALKTSALQSARVRTTTCLQSLCGSSSIQTASPSPQGKYS